MSTLPALPRNKLLTAAILVLFAAIVCLRMPEVIIKSRFWAEEGAVLFHNAWVMPPAQALLSSFAGYLNLAANATTLAARWLLPLRIAPYLTIAVALLVQLLPPLLLLTARDGWLMPARVRVVSVLLVLFVPAAEEVWLETLCCQFELALCCGIILALETDRGRCELLRCGLLLLSPLCGPVVIALQPLFLVRAALDRSSLRMLQAVALTTGAAVQLVFFVHATQNRSYNLNLVTLLDVFTVKHIYVPFLGVTYAASVAPLIQAYLLSGRIPIRATLLPVLGFGPFLFITLWRSTTRPAFWLLAAGGLLASAGYFGALGRAAEMIDARLAQRYAFAPQALFALATLALAATGTRWISIAAWVAVLWRLTIGGYEYLHPWGLISDGPPWRREVAAWQLDHTHILQIWPTGWTLSLKLPH